MGEKVAILGAGKMGEALLSGLLRAGRQAGDLVFTERHDDRTKMLEERYAIRGVTTAEAASEADTLLVALAAIDAWSWPGNVRELENRVKRAVIMADGKLVGAGDLDLQQGAEDDPDVLNLKSAREKADRKVIRHALARSEGNISSTARLLGISRPTLYDLLKQYGLQA